MWEIGRLQTSPCSKLLFKTLGAVIETLAPQIPQLISPRTHSARVALVIKYPWGSILINNSCKVIVLIQISLFESFNQQTSTPRPRPLTPCSLHMTSKIPMSTPPRATSSSNSSGWEDTRTTMMIPMMMQISLLGRLPWRQRELLSDRKLLPSMKRTKKTATTIGSSSTHSCYRPKFSKRFPLPKRLKRHQFPCRRALSPSGRWWACAFKVKFITLTIIDHVIGHEQDVESESEDECYLNSHPILNHLEDESSALRLRMRPSIS